MWREIRGYSIGLLITCRHPPLRSHDMIVCHTCTIWGEGVPCVEMHNGGERQEFTPRKWSFVLDTPIPRGTVACSWGLGPVFPACEPQRGVPWRSHVLC